MNERNFNILSITIAIIAIIVSFKAGETSQNANKLASAANNLATESNWQSQRQHEENKQIAQRLFDMEREFERPTLSLIRAHRIGTSKFVATIQNKGQRHVAIMSVEYRSEAYHGATGEGGLRTNAPLDNVARTFEIDLSNITKDPSPWNLARPLTIEPGAIVNVEVYKPSIISFGEFYLRSSEGIATGLGYFDDRMSASPF